MAGGLRRSPDPTVKVAGRRTSLEPVVGTVWVVVAVTVGPAVGVVGGGAEVVVTDVAVVVAAVAGVVVLAGTDAV